MSPMRQILCLKVILVLILASTSFVATGSDSDWSDDEHADHHHHLHHGHLDKHYKDNPPKDRILLNDTKTLVFYRNKRTTSRRTHSIHQLSCVGGTAGCKLFTPDVVECDNVGFNEERKKFDWKCRAEIGNRVTFNHVEIICEGYDYPEDDYILLGSCGLEFTLDYTDPHDHHENSYHKHMDEHDKELYRAKVKKTQPAPKRVSERFLALFNLVISWVFENAFLLSTFILLVICSLIVVRLFSSKGKTSSGKKSTTTTTGAKVSSGAGYGPLTSAVLTTKKIT